MQITDPIQLEQEAEEIQAFLEITSSDEIEEIVSRGNDLAVFLGRTGNMLADAKYHLNKKMKSDIMETLRKVANDTPYATARTINELVKSLCADEQYLVDFIERLNKSCTHQLDWCRSLLSKAKAEMTLTGMQNYNSRFD